MLILIAIGLLDTEWGQNRVAHIVTEKLSKDLQNRISINHVSFSFFDKMNLQGVLVEDQKRDTLLWAGNVQVNITDWFFFKDKADLKYVALENAVVHLNRTDSVWNYHFLESYFASTDTSKKKKAGIVFNLQKMVFNNVAFVEKDDWAGSMLTARVGHLDMDANDITISGKHIDLNRLNLVNPYFHTYSYTGKKLKAPTAPKDKSAQPWNIHVTDLTDLSLFSLAI